jgi:hypothetical protein
MTLLCMYCRTVLEAIRGNLTQKKKRGIGRNNFLFRSHFHVTHTHTRTVKPQFIASIWDPEKELWVRENDRCGSLYEIEFVEGPRKLNDGSRKTIHPGTIDRGFAVFLHV